MQSGWLIELLRANAALIGLTLVLGLACAAIYAYRHRQTLRDYLQGTRIHRPALISVLVTGGFALIGAVRVLSRSTAGSLVSGNAFLDFFAYQPWDAFNAQYFKMFHMPANVSAIYFIFRFLNWGHHRTATPLYESRHRAIGFESLWLRAALIGMIYLQVVVMELIDYQTRSIDPYSHLKSWKINVAIFVVTGLLTGWLMKYLSFAPLLDRRPPPPRRAD